MNKYGASDVDYTYDTTTGELQHRDFPVVSTAHVRTAYSYDAAGRLEYETVTKEYSGGPDNLYRTQYAYSWPAAAYVRQVVRTEKYDSSGWVDDNRVTYKTDSLGRLQYEEREDWSGAAWVSQYDITQAYDKNGNRTQYAKTLTGGTSGDYGITVDLRYSFDAVNALTAFADAHNGSYGCTVTCDACNNITALDETFAGTGHAPQTNHLYTYFDYDDLNRLTGHRTKAYQASGTAGWYWSERFHYYSATGAILKSAYRKYRDGGVVPANTYSQHIYDQGGRMVQNSDGSGGYGTHWRWAGAQHAGMGPLFGPNADTASQDAYNTNAAGGAGDPQRRTFIDPTPTEGDQRELWGQGRPQAKDSAAAWATGTVSDIQNANQNPVESRLMFEGTVSSTDRSRVTDAREKGRIGIFGTGLSYCGSSPRVTSETLGRDLNPLGRGDGEAYVAGARNLGHIYPALPMTKAQIGSGSSINNFTLSELANFTSSGFIKPVCYLTWAARTLAQQNPLLFFDSCESCPACKPGCDYRGWLANPTECAEHFCDCLKKYDCACSWPDWRAVPTNCVNCQNEPCYTSHTNITPIVISDSPAQLSVRYPQVISRGCPSCSSPRSSSISLSSSPQQGPLDPCRNLNPFVPYTPGKPARNSQMQAGILKAQDCLNNWKIKNPHKNCYQCIDGYLNGQFGKIESYQFDNCCCEKGGKEDKACCGGGLVAYACGAAYGRHDKILICPFLFQGWCQGLPLDYCKCSIAHVLIHEIAHHCNIWHQDTPNNDDIADDILDYCDCGKYKHTVPRGD